MSEKVGNKEVDEVDVAADESVGESPLDVEVVEPNY
jgi:hypothetical protein